MKFLPWIVVFLTVYLSTFIVFVPIWKGQYIDSGISEFLNLKIMGEVPQRRRPFTYSMKPWKINTETPRSSSLDIQAPGLRWSLIVFVKSHISHRSRRMLSRMTWSSFEYIDGVRIETVFIVGKANNADAAQTIQRENEKFGDLLQLDLDEKYASIGFKTLAGMQYAATHFPSNWMYATSDDDIAPDWVALIEKFDEMRNSTLERDLTKTASCAIEERMPILCGHGAVKYALPKRTKDSKWYISPDDYPLPTYPTYCLGGFYGMSVKLASELYEISRTLQFFWIDDVWITGFLRLKRFVGSNPSCHTDETVGLWSDTDYAYTSTGSEHELLLEWTKYVAKIHEKDFIYVNDIPGEVRGTPVPYEWKAWLQYVFQDKPNLL